MHRSGTSAIAGSLHNGGISMGTELLGHNEHNSKGHYEDKNFIKFHKSIASSRGLNDWKSYRHLSGIRWTHEEVSQVEELINLNDSSSCQWGIKDPRMCLYLKHWKKSLSGAYWIIVYRPCEEVANSLYRREIKNLLAKINFRDSQKLESLLSYTMFLRKIYFRRMWSFYNSLIINEFSTGSNNFYISHQYIKTDLELLRKWLEKRGLVISGHYDDFLDPMLINQKNRSYKSFGAIYSEFEKRRNESMA